MSENQNQYMLLFSLGPVQSFIAQARKTRDLWLGSFLLSVLMEASMKGIEQKNLIFPKDPKIIMNIPDLPNKYIALFPSEEDANKFADDSHKRMIKVWDTIRGEVWTEIIGKKGDDYTQTMWERQSKFAHFFEVFWVVSQRNDAAYSTWLKATQDALAARKRLRMINIQFDVDMAAEPDLLDEPGDKSTISGERAALHKENKNSREDIRAFWREITKDAKISVLDINKEGEERLDAIDTIKRFAYRSHILEEKHVSAGYPSTSSIAAATFVERLLATHTQLEIASALSSWINATKKLEEVKPSIPFLTKQVQSKFNTHEAQAIIRRDGDCYFQETFVARRLEKDYNITNKNSAEQLASQGQRALKRLTDETDKLGITRPTPYYAMIQMDGDRMGKLLDGVKHDEEHQAISGALSDFSRKNVANLVEEQYPGRLIYAGGDDVFALAPLARDYPADKQADSIITVLDLVNTLQADYNKIVAHAVIDEARKQQVSASAGIAIAHHYTALSYVRRVSKEAEDTAKKHYGRNSLVVTVLRRSGEQTRVGCRWSYPGLSREGQPIPLFSQFYRFFKEDLLSPKSVHLLLDEAITLVGLDKDAQASEIKRVLARQSTLQNFSSAPLAQQIVDLAEALNEDQERPGYKAKPEEKPAQDQSKQELPEARYEVELHSEKRRYGLVEVLGWLLVMAFLARKEQD